MKILYDHQIFTLQNYGGISRYFCELMNQFSQDSDIEQTLALRYSHNENLYKRHSLDPYWSNRSTLLCDSRIFPFIQRITHADLLNHLRINQRESMHLLKKQDYDVFHPTYYYPHFLNHLGKKPFVLTVYDMIHELYPEYFSPHNSLTLQKKQLIERADAVIAISHSTKNDIIRFTDADPDRISVIYLGNPLGPFEPLQLQEPDHDAPMFENNYLLFVGNRSGYKNFKFLVTSVAPILNKYESLHLYCAGGGPFTAGEIKHLKDLNILSKVHAFPIINDSMIKQFYKNAQAFIFPSLYEGFGLPVLEAFSCGCPVMVSNSSSLPEIAADAACYIDPEDAESIVQGVESILSNPHYRNELIQKGHERLKFFSWEKTATETKCVYNNLLYQ